MYTLIDTFNDLQISNHRTLAAVAAAQAKHQDAVRRANGPTSFLTYGVTRDGNTMTEREYEEYQGLIDAQN